MGMGGGGGTGGAMSDMNVTPLIDVLLVLLIIFMVIVPVTPKGLDTLVPQPPKDHKDQPENDRTIVVQVLSNGAGAPSYKINQDDFAKNCSGAEAGGDILDPSGEGDVRQGRQGPGLQQGC